MIVAMQLGAMEEKPAAERWGAIVAVVGGLSALIVATAYVNNKRYRYRGAR